MKSYQVVTVPYQDTATRAVTHEVASVLQKKMLSVHLANVMSVNNSRGYMYSIRDGTMYPMRHDQEPVEMTLTVSVRILLCMVSCTCKLELYLITS